MEYPIDLPGGGQMSTQTLCEGLVSCEISGEEAEPMGDSKAVRWEPVVICPKLLTKRVSDYPFTILEYDALENREDAKLPRLYNFVRRLGQFRRLIQKASPDLVHVSMSESLLTYGFIRWLPALRGLPFVYTDRGLCYGYRKHTKFFMRSILKHAAGMICTTEFNKDLWLKEALPTPITVIPNTISKVFSDYEPEKRKYMRERFQLSEADFVVGFAGRISEEKDWDFVPVLVKKLREAGVSFKVALVISTYEKQDVRIAAEITGKITESIGRENLIYMQDLTQAEISDYYYMVDVFVMSSLFESFGKAAVEAMSRKCSVVSTSVGGLKEVVGKEDNLYTKDRTDRFVDRVKKLSEDREELNRDREFFYKRYRDKYTLETHVKRHTDLYESIV